MKNPQDRRVRRTRKLLKASLLELMKKKPLSEITVADITENADINRGTFYLHFNNPPQLLQSMETDLLVQAQELIDDHIQETVGKKTIRPVLEPMLDFVVEHKELCTMLFENESESLFTEHLLQLIQHNASVIVKALPESHPEDSSYLLEFITFGLMGLIRSWFRQEMNVSKETLLNAAERLVDGAALHYMQGKMMKKEDYHG